MSVVVKRLKSSSMEVYVKGAPEVMADICDPSTCPYLHTISDPEYRRLPDASLHFCSPQGLRRSAVLLH